MSSAGYSSLPPYGAAGGSSSGTFSDLASRTHSVFITRRPWREWIAHPSSYSVSYGLRDLFLRIQFNLAHFRVNYAMITLLVLFLSLVYHPISMIVYLVMFVLWILLYFSRDEPIAVFNHAVDDRLVLAILGILTIVCLILTSVWLNVLVALLVSAAIVVLHATFRVTEDLFLDEDEIAGAGLVSVVGSRF